MPTIGHKFSIKQARKLRVSGKLVGTAERPRLAVFRSNAHVYLQAIDDATGKTVVSAGNYGKTTAKKKQTKTEAAIVVAKEMVKSLQAKKISAVVFDRGANRYHGRVKAIAETLRAEGITV